MAAIFISYRQADANPWAISLRDDLAEVFGEDQVFLDKDTLHAGNWREQIHLALERCKVVLVVIGPQWLTVTDEQNRPRLQLADDVHRQEVTLALSRSELTVIPVLVDDAPMPRAEQLPPDLNKLCDKQARKIGDTRARRKADLNVLVNDISLVGGIAPRPRADPQDRPTLQHAAQASRLRLDMTTPGIAFVLTVVAAIYEYSKNMPLGVADLSFLFMALSAAVLVARGLWVRIRDRTGGKG